MTGSAMQPVRYRAYAAEEVVTGEGVALELPVANLGSRLVSCIIDVVVTGVVLLLVMIGLSRLTAVGSDAVQRAFTIAAVALVLVILPATVETLTRGKSLGKLVMGLRVVRDDGGPVTFRHALTRALVAVLETYAATGVVAAISGLANSRVKRLGDFAAGTYVITERSKLTPPPPPEMPPALAHWAAAADIAALDRGLDLAVRQFLQRSVTLLPGPRAQLGAALLSRVMERVAPMPPPGHHPETVLQAVAAERFRRDLARLQREQALRERVLPASR